MLLFLSRKPTAPDSFSSSNGRRVDQEIPRREEAYIVNPAPPTGLSNTAVGSIVSSLHRKHLFTISMKCFEGQLSPPTTRYRLESKGFFSTSVRVDRNCFQKILIDFEGSVLSRPSHASIPPEPATALDGAGGCLAVPTAWMLPIFHVEPVKS